LLVMVNVAALALVATKAATRSKRAEEAAAMDAIAIANCVVYDVCRAS
jgi:hypothetical protein